MNKNKPNGAPKSSNKQRKGYFGLSNIMCCVFPKSEAEDKQLLGISDALTQLNLRLDKIEQLIIIIFIIWALL